MTTEQSHWLDDNTDPEQHRREIQGAINHHAARKAAPDSADVLRELAKVEAALAAAEEHLTKQNEANAALHLSERVLYSPLTVAVVNARESATKIRTHLET
ncbi:hypothetical protein [Salininema proteolyticum]|uniref:Uncharacterized protein n=1 Tax=Salininema proteolyticum TaxID=1607685 RepID=A0ABV8TTH7_9ACTN